MQARKQSANKLIILALVATANGLLIWGLPTRAADAKPEKSPRALLHVAAHAPKVLFTTGDKSDDYNRYLQTQFALIKSRLVLDAALQQPAIAQLAAISKQADPVGWLEQNLETSNVKNSELMQVSLSPRSGANGKDQSAIINAVVSAYLQEVAGVEAKRLGDRHSQLKKLRATYMEIIKERRETVRKLSESVGSAAPLSDVEQNSLVHRREKLVDQRLKLRLDRAEVETLLGRRQKAANRESDAIRKEIGQLEDRLAILTAQETVLQEELNQVAGEKRNASTVALDLKHTEAEIAQMEEAGREIGAEVERLDVELAAPPRVRIIEIAVPPKQ